MNFFEQQARAKRHSVILTVIFLLAVAAIICSVYLIISLVYLSATNTPVMGDLTHYRPTRILWNPKLFAIISGFTLVVVLLGSLYKLFQLRGGGESVAQMLNAKKLFPSTHDLNEKKVLNVVEEMAIASGIPVPAVYLLENEQNINAFAAGIHSSDAVVGVTRGCIETLSRDELQGVIAHEFSHIFNGDMRLNIRLMGLLHGILVIALLGRIIFEGSARTGTVRLNSGRSRDKNGAPFLILGLGLMVVGYVGVFFGRLIKAAISRQREFLADASAVQFTRNPGGISGALKKIGADKYGSVLSNLETEEISHFLFSDGIKHRLVSILSTHPPLITRIKRIEPNFDGDFTPFEPKSAPEPLTENSLDNKTHITLSPIEIINTVGSISAGHIAYAEKLRSELPPELLTLASEAYGARACIYGLLLSTDGEQRANQVKILMERCEEQLMKEVRRGIDLLAPLKPAYRLPLVEIALGPLKDLSQREYEIFRSTVGALVWSDQLCTHFEYALQRMIMRHLDHKFGFKPALTAVVNTATVQDVLPACAELLSALSRLGNRSEERARAGYAAGMRALGQVSDFPVESSLEKMDQALTLLEGAAPLMKQKVFKACVDCIFADESITIEEGELIRAIGSALGCPVPPFIITH